MFNKKNLHLVPQLLQDRANEMVSSSNSNVCENIAHQLEAVVEFCNIALSQYNKKKYSQEVKIHRKGPLRSETSHNN